MANWRFILIHFIAKILQKNHGIFYNTICIRIEVNIPKKRTGSTAHTKSLTKFYEAVYRAILTHIPFDKIKCVLLGSPGFQKDDFFKFMMTECVKRDDRSLIENKNKFVLCHASSGHKHAIEEIFLDESVLSKVTETKVRFALDLRMDSMYI